MAKLNKKLRQEIYGKYNGHCEACKFNTFIHEVVHGVLDTMGESDLSKNEKFVCMFSSLLVDPIEEIVKANKKVQD